MQKYRLYLTKSKYGRKKRFCGFSLNRKRSVFESGPKHLTKSHRLQMETFSQGSSADDRRPVKKEIELQSANMPYIDLRMTEQTGTIGAMDMPRRSIPCPGINLSDISGEINTFPASRSLRSFSVRCTQGLDTFPDADILSSDPHEARQPGDFGYGSNYVGLQLHAGIGQISLAQYTFLEPEPINPAIGASEDEHMDYTILDQLLQEELAPGETRSSMLMDFQSSSPRQSDSMTPSNGRHLSADKPCEELQAGNEVSTNGFADIGLDNMMSLLLNHQVVITFFPGFKKMPLELLSHQTSIN